MNDPGDGVRRLYEQLIEAWNRMDASATARLYSPGGGQVGFDGSEATGPEEIERHLAPIFKDHQVARFVTIVRDVRGLSQEVAILRAVAGMVPRGETRLKEERNVIHTLVAGREQDGEWKVHLFQNTPAAWHGRDADRRALTAELQAQADQVLGRQAAPA